MIKKYPEKLVVKKIIEIIFLNYWRVQIEIKDLEFVYIWVTFPLPSRIQKLGGHWEKFTHIRVHEKSPVPTNDVHEIESRLNGDIEMSETIEQVVLLLFEDTDYKLKALVEFDEDFDEIRVGLEKLII
jgi:hypothetical protein